jgi:hypothetical protein
MSNLREITEGRALLAVDWLLLLSKLPHFLQEKWTTLAASYKKTHQVSFPPFSFFVRFIRDICEIRNDPAFSHSNCNQSTASVMALSTISGLP